MDHDRLTVYDEASDAWKLVPGSYTVMREAARRNFPSPADHAALIWRACIGVWLTRAFVCCQPAPCWQRAANQLPSILCSFRFHPGLFRKVAFSTVFRSLFAESGWMTGSDIRPKTGFVQNADRFDRGLQ